MSSTSSDSVARYREIESLWLEQSARVSNLSGSKGEGYLGCEGLELAPPVVKRERRDLGRAAVADGDEEESVGVDLRIRLGHSFQKEETAPRNFSQVYDRQAGSQQEAVWEHKLSIRRLAGRAAESEYLPSPVSILSSGKLHSPVGPVLGSASDGLPGHNHLIGKSGDREQGRGASFDFEPAITLSGSQPAKRLDDPVDRVEQANSLCRDQLDCPSATEMDEQERMREGDYGSDSSLDEDLESVRSSFDFFESQRPSFDFTSEFKGQFRPLPSMIPEPSQNLEGFRDMASDTLSLPRASGDLESPSTSSQEFMQMVSDQVDNKLSRPPPKGFLNLIGAESDGEDSETDLMLLDHETAEQFIKASLRMQLLHYGLLVVASLTVAGFMLSILFSNLKSSIVIATTTSKAGPPRRHDWWIFGSAVAQALVAMLAILATALVGAYVSDSRRAVQKAQVQAENREQKDLVASRRSERRAMERARTATRAKQQFMAYVFHNIRVPFNAIVLGLGHMRAADYGDSLPGDKMDLVQMMLDCAETMTSVLDDVTDMSQWEDNKLELRTDNFDLLAVVRFLSWGLRDLLDQKNIKFGMVIDPRARAVLNQHKTVGDKHRVVQVLGQFLSNAVKLTPKNGDISLVMACEDLEWIDEEPLGQIGWRIVRTERRSSRSHYPPFKNSDEDLSTSPSLSRSISNEQPSSAEEMLPRKKSLPPRGTKPDPASGGEPLKRRPRRRSFERAAPASTVHDPFSDIPAVQRVVSDDLDSGGADSEPGGSDPAPRVAPHEKGEQTEESAEKRSPRMEANKPAPLVIPGGTQGSMVSPEGPLEICRMASFPSSSGGSSVQKHESLPSTSKAKTPASETGLELAASPGNARKVRRSLDSASPSPGLTADIVAALSGGDFGPGKPGMQDRIEGLKLPKEAVARMFESAVDPPTADLEAGLEAARSPGGVVYQLEGGGAAGMELSPNEGTAAERKSRDEVHREIRKQKRKGLNETILTMTGEELLGDRGRRPTPRKRNRSPRERRNSTEEKTVPGEGMPTKVPEKMVPTTGSNESLSPSSSARMHSSKSLASLPIVGFATIRISVKDTGPAITEEEQEKLFEPYSRMATGCMQRAGVSTLGLSLAKRFVRQVGGSIGADSQTASTNSSTMSPSSTSVGGSIGVDSQAPNGNSFWFSIPFPLVAEEENGNESTTSVASSDAEKLSDSTPPPPSPSEPLKQEAQDEVNRMFTDKLAKKLSGGQQAKASAVGRALHQAITRSLSGSLRGDVEQMSVLRKQLSVEKEGSGEKKSQADRDANEGKRRVLLVEDTEINRIIMRKVLQNLGLLCDEAENGQVAVDLMKQGRNYDLILMDKEMPVMDGHEATRSLRKMGVKTPIIALTGNALKSDRELFFEAGVDEFQTKPLSRDKLVQLLVRLGWKKEQLGKGGVNVLVQSGPLRKATAAG